LRKAVNDLIPERIIKRPKQGFGASALQWLRDREIHSYISGVIEDAHIRKEGLDYGAAERLLQLKGFRKGREAYCTWSLFMLELWYRTFFESEGDKAINV
jgi:asparagine synthetase B (glutamine-hydrolysing)